MNAKDVIKSSMGMSLHVLKAYFADLSDAELLKRPGTGCNHLAWQLGHLIISGGGLLSMVCPGAAPELPAGFAENHSKEMATSDDASKFCSKQKYIELLDQMQAATVKALDSLPDSRLDEEGPEKMRGYCPTVASIFSMIASHPLMHAGQFVPVRRALGKPVVI